MFPTRVQKMKCDRRKAGRYTLFVSVLMVCMGIGTVFGHGSKYEILSGGVIGIRAAFDTGVPMADADVLIFAPNETVVTMKSRTDSRGVVCFAPDRAGAWVLQVRAEGGHGMRINLEVDENSLAAASAAGFSSLSDLQKIFLAVCVCWGFVGTGLYFSGRKKREKDKNGE